MTAAALLRALGEAGDAATSLAEQLGRPVDRNAFAAAFLNALDKWHAIYLRHGPAACLRAWGHLDIVGGRRVAIRRARSASTGGRSASTPMGIFRSRTPAGESTPWRVARYACSNERPMGRTNTREKL